MIHTRKQTVQTKKQVRRTSRALGITRLCWFLFHIVMFSLADWHEQFFPSVICGLVIATIVPQLYLRSERSSQSLYPVMELVCSGAVFLYATFIFQSYSSFMAIPALCAAVRCEETRTRIYLWTGFGLIPVLAGFLVSAHERMGLGVLDGAFFFGLGYAIQRILQAHRMTQHLLEENAMQNEALVQYAKQVETITLLEERNRLARELHDTVGHTLTSVIMGMDAVSYLIESAPEKAKDKIDQLRQVTRQGLEEVRRQIHHIAPVQEHEPTSRQLKRVANEFALHTGTRLEFETIGHERLVPFQTTITLIRCLQESLTNAVRHGDAKKIQVTLCLEPDHMILKIRDDGKGMKQIQFGFGLTVMRERLEALQGELVVEAGERQGTAIICQLPIRMEQMGGQHERQD